MSARWFFYTPIIVGALVLLKGVLMYFTGATATFSLLVLAVLLCAWYGGLGPGLFATSLAAIGNVYFLIPPTFTFFVTEEQFIPVLLFVIEGVLISAMCEARLRAEREKNEFIAIASHELRNPLAAVVGYAELLLHDADKPQRVREYAQTIMRQAHASQRFVEDLLDAVRLQTGTISFSQEPFDLRALLRELAEIHSVRSKTHRVTLEADQPFFMQGDRGRIAQVFDNLISNAIKYSPGAERVYITLHAHESKAQVVVQDFGPGIQRDEQSKIFRRFYRTERARKSALPGAGIGLHIAERIVRGHGGTIKVQSEEGKGSIFTVCLPRAPQPWSVARRFDLDRRILESAH